MSEPLNVVAMSREDAVMLVRFKMCPPRLQDVIRRIIRGGSRGGGTGGTTRRIESDEAIVMPAGELQS